MTLRPRIRTAALPSLIAATVVLAGCAAPQSHAPAPSGSAVPAVAEDAKLHAMLPARIQQSGTVRVASDIPYAPMEFYQVGTQQITGVDYDLGQALGARLGVKFEFAEQNLDATVAALQANKFDLVMSGMNDTKEREQTLDFVDYFRGGMSILVKKGNPNGVGTLTDLCGRTVAVQNATVQAELLGRHQSDCTAAGKGPITITQLPTDGEAQLSVRSGKAVADVLDAPVAAYNAQTAGGGSVFEVVNDPAAPGGYEPVVSGVGVLKANSELSRAVQAALQSLIDDGTYLKTLQKWNVTGNAVTRATLNGAL